ncbi:baseplate J/gp47 family protein [Nonomuraea endophytica]|uniref:baseplate J/gp47 family protein n=1 Tax=Nonomuraea endophytica TaxID=714136 RepID=UPI0037C7581F
MARPDQRTYEEIVAELAGSAAAAAPVPGLDGRTWAQLLFAGNALSDPAEPSQALLALTAEAQRGLADHLATTPAKARLAWLADTLGIARRPMLPDEVVAVVSLPPARPPEPVVLPGGTELRGGKTAAGVERTYVTTDTLTVHGAALLAAHGTYAETGLDRAAVWSEPALPFAPFAGTAAAHHLDIVTDAIAFTGGDATVTVTFPGQDSTRLAGLRWQWSTPAELKEAPPSAVTCIGSEVRLKLTGECGPMDVDGEIRTFLRVSFSGDTPQPRAYTFETGEINVVIERTGVRPQGGFHGDGEVDLSREFQPFGPTPRRGDSFYLRCDEAFSKPLASLTLNFTLVDETTHDLHTVDYSAPYQKWFGGWMKSQNVMISAFAYRPPEPRLLWQRFTSGAWSTFHPGSRELHGAQKAPVGTAGAPLSDHDVLAGVGGHFIRLFLSGGDFGWEDYLARVAAFAEAVARRDPFDAGALIAPVPPTVSTVTIGYRTAPVAVTDVRAVNAHATRRRTLPGPVARPFEQPLDVSGGAAGVVSFGFTLPRPRPGAGLSWYARLTQAPACSSAGRTHEASWEYWAGTAWKPLTVLDGTAGLRQSGLVRFVMPHDWGEGCPEESAASGRWIRLRTATPAFVGELLAVRVDAVTARYRSALPDPDLDATPATPLTAGELKGLRAPSPGVKATNPDPGLPGRAAEDDAAYLPRAAAVVRHRNRAVQPWDYEALVREEFPEVAAIRCLPHTGPDGCAVPGQVGLVIVPHSAERLPYPSVTLAARVADRLAGVVPAYARLNVLCPVYVEVRVRAVVRLRPGVAAAEAAVTLNAALEARLHPGGRDSADFGRALYPSSLVVLLEDRPEVDHLAEFALLAPHDGAARVSVDACRGLIASGGAHELDLREALT